MMGEKERLGEGVEGEVRQVVPPDGGLWVSNTEFIKGYGMIN